MQCLKIFSSINQNKGVNKESKTGELESKRLIRREQGLKVTAVLEDKQSR